MSERSAVAKYSPIRPNFRPEVPSNLIPVDFANKTRLPENVTRLPESGSNLTLVTDNQELAPIVRFPGFGIEISVIPPKPEIDLIQQVKKAESFHPGKAGKSYIDNLGRYIIRRRRGSRCLAQADHEPQDCRGRVHLKKSTSTQIEPTQPNTVKNEKPPKQTNEAKSKKRDVVLNGKKLR